MGSAVVRTWHELNAHERQRRMLRLRCPTCHAEPGRACIRNGKPTLNLHVARLWAARQIGQRSA